MITEGGGNSVLLHIIFPFPHIISMLIWERHVMLYFHLPDLIRNLVRECFTFLEAEYPPALLTESSVTPDDKGIRVFLDKPGTIVKSARFIGSQS